MKFNRIKTLWIVIVILTALNIATLISLWLVQNPDEPLPSPRQRTATRPFLERRLNFTESQSEAYSNLRQAHFQKAGRIYSQIRNQKSRLYSELDAGDTAYTDIAERIGQLHAELEILTFEHFRQVRELGDPEQQRRMDSVMQDVVDRTSMGRGMHRREGRGRRFRDQPMF